jgi:hypothetical protein
MTTTPSIETDVTKFEVGCTYVTSYVSNHETKTRIRIVSRTAQTVTYSRDGDKNERRKIHIDVWGGNRSELVYEGTYSMAPLWTACDLEKGVGV